MTDKECLLQLCQKLKSVSICGQYIVIDEDGYNIEFFFNDDSLNFIVVSDNDIS